MLTITEDEHGLLAAFPGSDGDAIRPVSDDSFYHTERDARITFIKDSQKQTIGLTWQENGQVTKAPRLGPLVHSLQVHPDPDSALTQRIAAILTAMAEGGKAVQEIPGLTPGCAPNSPPRRYQSFPGSGR